MAGSIARTVHTYTHERHILCRPLPLSACHIRMPRLMERAGLSCERSGTVFMMAVPYLIRADVDDPARNLSLYAVPRDYHLFFQEVADDLIPLLRRQFSNYRFAVFTDHSPIAEAKAAEAAGLGEVGMNGLLLTAEYGSFVFIGELITDAPFDTVVKTWEGATETDNQLCSHCGACMRACPASCGDGRQNCLSALTQKKGALSPDEEETLTRHPLVWGCDICQTVCPVNRRIIKDGTDTPIPFFREERMIRAREQDILNMSDKSFSDRAFSWRGRKTILRNVTIHDHSKGGDRS